MLLAKVSCDMLLATVANTWCAYIQNKALSQLRMSILSWEKAQNNLGRNVCEVNFLKHLVDFMSRNFSSSQFSIDLKIVIKT